jgi:hypothetical protein
MIKQSFNAGLAGLRRRPGLIVLLYAMNLVLALVLSIPVAVAFGGTVGPTGFGEDLAAGFDIVLWADIIEEAGEALLALFFHLLWMIPLYLIWKAAAGVGLIHALRGDGIRSFWQGVGRYTAKALLLGLAFLVLTALGVVLGVAVVLVLGGVWAGEVGTFWVNGVVAPTLLISLLAVLDLMHDYARIALVVDDEPVLTAIGTGFTWPFRHGNASRLYVLWFVPAAVLLLLPTVLDLNATAATAGAVWTLFLAQQVLLLLRAAVTVGWFGSETAFYETIRRREMPLIAEDAAEGEAVSDDAPRAAPGGLESGFEA